MPQLAPLHVQPLWGAPTPPVASSSCSTVASEHDFWERWVWLRELGRGAFGEVCLCRDLSDRLAAVKVVFGESGDDLGSQEPELLRELADSRKAQREAANRLEA